MNTPYTTKSGLKIGCNYTPPVKRQPLTRTEAMLQSALLDDTPERDWSGIWIVFGCAVLITVPCLILAWSRA
jgi:hypothetical protein